MVIGPDLSEWIDATICYVYPEPVDHRLKMNGLGKLVKGLMEPSVGDVFAFFSKGQTCVKLLQWHEDGIALLEHYGDNAARMKKILEERSRRLE